MDEDDAPSSSKRLSPTSIRTPLLAGKRGATQDYHMRSKSVDFLREEEREDAVDEGSWLYEITTNYRKLKKSQFSLKSSWQRFVHGWSLYDRDMLKRDVITGVSCAGLLLPGVCSRCALWALV